MTTRLCMFVFLLAFAGCSSIDFSEIDGGSYGDYPFEGELEAKAEQYLERVLFDPESRRIRWVDKEPKKSALWTGLLNDGWVYGWTKRFGLNAKNRFGGYTGEKAYFVMIASTGTLYVNEMPADNMLQVSDL